MAIGVNLFYNSIGKAVPWRKTARLAAPNGPFYTAKRPILQCRGATLTMPKFTSHFSHSFTAIVYILEHPLLNDFTALEKCP